MSKSEKKKMLSVVDHAEYEMDSRSLNVLACCLSIVTPAEMSFLANK